MSTLINSDDRRTRIALTAGAVALLLACLGYNIYILATTPNPKITYDARWEVIEIGPCDGGPELCPNQGVLRLHDRLVRVGEVSFDDYVEDPNLVPFGDFGPGDTVTLMVLRNGRRIEVEWLMPPIRLGESARFAVISLLVYGSFWLAGTFVLLYMRPADSVWALLTALYYLTTIWLAVGLYSLSNVAYSAVILRLVGWLMVPVLIRLHLLVPGSLVGRHRRAITTLTYGLAVLLLALQLTGNLPWFAYLAGITVAAVISIALLAFRLLTPQAPNEKLAARLMLVGIVLALAPGLLLSAVPLVLDIGTAGVVGASLSVLALPMLPLFYTYAIYKHRLGLREHRINRLLVQYAVFLLYLIILTLSFTIMISWVRVANELLVALVLVGLAVFIALLPVRQPIQAVLDRLTYGTRYSHRDILEEYAERIPAAVDRHELIHLLKNELTTDLEIRQSALVTHQDGALAAGYWQGVGPADCPETWPETRSLLSAADHFQLPETLSLGESSERLRWIRLAIPLSVQGRATGAWLFGRRRKDDIYSQDDIDLLERLSGLLAISLESSGLLEALSHELATREQAEATLEAQSRRLSLLHEIDRAILAASSPAEIAKAATAGICHLVPCIRASVFLFDTAHDSVKVLAAQGSGTAILADNDTMPFAAFPAHKALLDGQRLVMDDIQNQIPDSELAAMMAPSGIRAVISAPLMASGNVFGALSVASAEPGAYAATHIAVVEEVATSVALAIHNGRLREAVDKNSRELQLLSARLINAQETERKRLSRELHDEMGQILAAISLNLAAIERNLPPDGNETLRTQLADAGAFVTSLTDQVRSLSLELRPLMLHDLGLKPTLRWYVANYTRRRDMDISLDIDDLPDRLPEAAEITAYRVVQEALTNVNRHAQASAVRLHLSQSGGNIQVTIEDNGRGFDLDKVKNEEQIGAGIGLVMMRERVSALDGHLEVYSRLGDGTRITADIPCGDNS